MELRNSVWTELCATVVRTTINQSFILKRVSFQRNCATASVGALQDNLILSTSNEVFHTQSSQGQCIRYVGEQEDSFTFLCLCRNQEFPVEKCQKYMKAMQDLPQRNLKKTSQSELDIYLTYFDKLQHKLFYNCKVLEKYGFFQKHFSPIHSETNSLLNH